MSRNPVCGSVIPAARCGLEAIDGMHDDDQAGAGGGPEDGRPGEGGLDAHETFVRLLLEHEGRVRGFIRGLVPTWNDVDEVVQQASLVAWRKFSQFDPRTNFGTWLMVIARFEALKHRRRVARGPLSFSADVWDLLAAEADPAAHVEEALERRRAALEACLATLGDDRRRVVLEAYAPGVKIYELARRLGRGEQAFYKMLQRLRAALLDCMRRRLAAEGAA
jgi:RNA polymerase sigma-70 factor (ECF subfamily)